MASGKNVADLKRTLLKPALTSHFEIAMDSPFKAGGTQGGQSSLSKFGVRFEQDQLNLMCSEVSLPGSNLATLELTSDHTGVTERHAYRRIFDDRLDFTFYVDAANYMPIRFFEAWIDWIVGFDGGDTRDASSYYRAKYRDDYAVDGLKITKFEKSSPAANSREEAVRRGQPATSLTYGFVKAYPISINSMPVSYEASSLLKCTVSMTYMRYYIDRPQRIAPPADISGRFNPQRNLSIAEQALQNASQFLPPAVRSVADVASSILFQ
jgi:hypothetical protein